MDSRILLFFDLLNLKVNRTVNDQIDTKGLFLLAESENATEDLIFRG